MVCDYGMMKQTTCVFGQGFPIQDMLLCICRFGGRVQDLIHFCPQTLLLRNTRPAAAGLQSLLQIVFFACQSRFDIVN